jgi:hypothetical protein
MITPDKSPLTMSLPNAPSRPEDGMDRIVVHQPGAPHVPSCSLDELTAPGPRWGWSSHYRPLPINDLNRRYCAYVVCDEAKQLFLLQLCSPDFF